MSWPWHFGTSNYLIFTVNIVWKPPLHLPFYCLKTSSADFVLLPGSIHYRFLSYFLKTSSKDYVFYLRRVAMIKVLKKKFYLRIICQLLWNGYELIVTMKDEGTYQQWQLVAYLFQFILMYSFVVIYVVMLGDKYPSTITILPHLKQWPFVLSLCCKGEMFQC